jgi:hypothetical protein
VQSLTVLGSPRRVKMAGATPAASKALAVSSSVQRSSSACSTAQCTCTPTSGKSSAIRCNVRPSTCTWPGAWLAAANPGACCSAAEATHALPETAVSCTELSVHPSKRWERLIQRHHGGAVTSLAWHDAELSYKDVYRHVEGIANSQRSPRASDLTAKAHGQPFPAISNCDATAGRVSDRV